MYSAISAAPVPVTAERNGVSSLSYIVYDRCIAPGDMKGCGIGHDVAVIRR